MSTIRISMGGEIPMVRQVVRMFKGTSYSLGFEFVDVDGAPYDLTGSVVKFRMKETPERDEYLLLKTLSWSDPGNDAENGTFIVVLAPEDSAPLMWGHHFWGVTIQLAGGEMIEPAGGLFVLMQGTV